MKANNLLSQFGDHRQRVQSAITAVCERRGILLVDDENRENEGDLIFSAQSMTETDMAIMIRHCSGIVCLCITEEKARQLNLPLMVEQNTSKYGTAFTISIEAAEGVTTGVSAADRIQTIRTAIAPNATPESLHHPGHIFPLIARSVIIGQFTKYGTGCKSCQFHQVYAAFGVTAPFFDSAGTGYQWEYMSGMMTELWRAYPKS